MNLRRLKNLLLLSCSALLRKKKRKTSKKKFIAIATTALGDSLWSTAAIRAVQNHFAGSIDVLTNPLGAQVFAYNPDVANTFVLERCSLYNCLQLRSVFLQNQYDAALIFHTSQRLILPLLACSDIPELIGTQGLHKGLDSLLTHCVPNAAHELDRRNNIIQTIGASINDFSLLYFVQPEEIACAKNWIKKHISSKKKRILLHPGAKDRFKCWPVANYIILAQQLQQNGYEVLISTGRNEKDIEEQVKKNVPKAILVNNLSLRHYAAVMQQMDVIVSNDTGPMHLACALKKQVIAIFSPTHPRKGAPYNVPTAYLMYKPRSCTPCLRRKCKEPFCLQQISVEEIFAQITTIFTQNI